MFPAARIGDPITHDMLVPSGLIGPQAPGPCPLCASQIVMIEMLPAAHVLCTCICTGATSAGPMHPPIPGPQPPIVKGSLTVLIHSMPAARWAPSLDVSACGVFLGDPKLAATRTVLIGDVGGGGAAIMAAIVGAVNPSGSTVNCGNIIDAAIDRLTGNDRDAQSPAGQDGTFAQIAARHGTTFPGGSTFGDAFNAVRDSGDGAIAIVAIDYGPGSGAHIVVMANQGGTVGIIEGQNWGAGNPQEVITTPARANARYNPGGGTNVGYGLVRTGGGRIP